jgi:Cu/Ag efflux pump CusA
MMIIVAMFRDGARRRLTGVGPTFKSPCHAVVVGGLCSTPFLTLFALPALSACSRHARDRV